ncbi:GTPase [Anaerobacillus isosaccharinicus]|uniref:50S ribosome-binding GTPase n=1 Tax=Anaerobacillus isosaccharinicus TaxID=1532552 RepID=A0A1S2M7C2_9BACI|nr:GTPase [Anaerobacillus isosaccharinicus]MBA5587020.1 50S ribosome-binding GTPase [Anaerobacillus isosaccharinicus]QOY34780.1 50S ribosome-binding GTPase [Anaerobacillus isosaccharinicus]
MSEEKNFFDEEQLEKDFEEAFRKTNAELDELFKQKLVISLLGDVNVGKSSTINALTGKKLSEVGAYAGLTTEVKPYYYSENVIIADTPGLADINQEVSNQAEDFVHEDADIIMFFFNAAVGPTKHMIDTYNKVKKLNKPIITVLNKIDIWYEDGILEDKDAYETVISQIKKETGQKVIPISAKKYINVEELNNEIISILESSGKDLFFLKVSKYKENKVKGWINGAAVSAFGIGVIPVPTADIIPLTSLQVALALKIAYIYNCKVSKNDVMSLIGSTITGSLGKQLFKYGVQLLKGLGWAGGRLGTGATATLGGTVAASITYGFGWTCNAYYKSGMNIDLGHLGEIYTQSYKEYFKNNQSVPSTV